jgi:hypothetical protein
MGRSKHIYSNAEKTQLKIELYCQACAANFYNENYSKGKLVGLFERHTKTRKHMFNTEKHRMELEDLFKTANDEKLSINDTQYSGIIDQTDYSQANSKIELEIGDDIISVTKHDYYFDHDEHLTSISSIISKNSLLKIENRVKEMNDAQSILLSNYNTVSSRTHELSESLQNSNNEIKIELDKIRQELRKNKTKNVTFNDKNNNNNNENDNITLCELITNQAKLITNYELNDENEDLKKICKQLLMSVSNKEVIIYELVLKQYTILDKYSNNIDSRDKLLEINNQLLKLSAQRL